MRLADLRIMYRDARISDSILPKILLEWKLRELAPEILALVEAAKSEDCLRDNGSHNLPYDVREALADFNAKLESL